MRILLTGSSGFIGHTIYQSLKQTDNEIIPISSKELDFNSLDENSDLSNLLTGIDIVINTVGIISETTDKTFEQIHTKAPIVLFDGCKKYGITKIIQISALGSQVGTTPYHTSKNRADVYLRDLGVDYIILHPSIVYGDDGKSTALFKALASLPFIPIIGDGSQVFQPICIDDLVETINKSIKTDIKNMDLDLVGEKPITYKNILKEFRKYLGYKETKCISLPTIGTNIIGKILDEPTINRDNITMLNQGNIASVKPLANFLGYTPASINKKLFDKKSGTNSEKLYASLYFIRPLLRIIIGFVWIWSGIVSAFLYPQELGLKLLNEVGVANPYDLPMLYIASFLDIILGILITMGYKLKTLLTFSLLVISVYTIILTILAPYHWLHPFGHILKNIPLLCSIYILIQMEKYK